MSTNFKARILKEIKLCSQSKLFKFLCDIEGNFGEKNNCYIKWEVQEGTYKGQIHILKVAFIYGTNEVYEFPKKPPNVRFITPIYHTNISQGGDICLDVLRDDPSDPQSWSPMYTMENIFNSIVLLLECHNPKSPFNMKACKDYQNLAPQEFAKKCQTYYNSMFKNTNLISSF
jgi:ubiquitin-protein ligase